MTVFDLVEAESVLERTPRVLTVLLDGLPDNWLDERNEGDESFSPRDVVAHLADAERDNWMGRVRTLLEHGEARPFDVFDRFRFKSLTGEPVGAVLRMFADLRARNLADLRALRLTDTALERTGTHPSFGRVTLGQLLATWVVHDLSHLAQIERVMARRYRSAVGPWQEYLPLLKDRST